jgi:hypothetical protein
MWKVKFSKIAYNNFKLNAQKGRNYLIIEKDEEIRRIVLDFVNKLQGLCCLMEKL